MGEMTVVSEKSMCGRKFRGPGDLKEHERKVVIYSNKNKTIVVPDDAWDGKGDLSNLPIADRRAIAQASKYRIKRRGSVIGPDDKNDLGVSGARVLGDLDKKGYAEIPHVEIGEEKIVRMEKL